jgi:predicted PurR-regulated permease PerM
LFIAFFFYRDGDQLVSALRTGLSRVAGGFADDVLGTINATIQGVVLGLVGTAAAQAAVALIGFVIVGAPLPWALAAAVGVLSIVPAGPPLVWGGVTVWLITQGSVGYAAFMGLWGMFGISGIDNVVKPILISRGSSLPFVLVLTGVFGGLVAFGFVGVFLGPVLLAVGYAAGRRWAGLEEAPRTAPSLTGR